MVGMTFLPVSGDKGPRGEEDMRSLGEVGAMPVLKDASRPVSSLEAEKVPSAPGRTNNVTSRAQGSSLRPEFDPDFACTGCCTLGTLLSVLRWAVLFPRRPAP